MTITPYLFCRQKHFNSCARLFVLAATLFVAWAGMTATDAQAQSISAPPEKLRAAFSVWEPFAIEDETGLHGIDPTILAELARRMDKSLELVPCPWRRCLKMLRDGDIDILSSLAQTIEREQFAFYIKPAYSRVTPLFYVSIKSHMDITRYGDLSKLAIGSAVDSRYFEPFDSDTSLNKFEATSEMLLLRMLEAGRVDTIVGSDANVDFEIRRNNLGNIIRKATFRPDYHNDIHIAVSRKSPLMGQTKKIAQIVSDLRKEGFIAKVHARYWPSRDPAT